MTNTYLTYEDTSARNNDKEMSNLLQLYTSFINSFDGSPNAFTIAEPIMDKVFDPSFILDITYDGPKDLQWYRNFVQSFATQGDMASVTHIKQTNDSGGIQVTIKNIVAGVEMDLITYNGTAKREDNGEYKLTYFEVSKDTPSKTNHHLENVGKMVRLVGTGSTTKEVVFICKMNFVSGMEDTFKLHARRAVESIKHTERDGTLSFQIYFSHSNNCHTVERYRDSQAAIEHLCNMQKNKDRNACISEFAQISVLEVYGPTSKELKALLDEENYLVEYHGSSKVSI